MEGDRTYPIWALLLGSGLRIGELVFIAVAEPRPRAPAGQDCGPDALGPLAGVGDGRVWAARTSVSVANRARANDTKWGQR